MAKMELQTAGWPHWHVLVDVPPWVRLPRKGAFDAFWPMGFSNVQHGFALSYVCGVVAYACKSAVAAGDDGLDVLERSGLPASGFKWVTTARNYWASWRCPDDDDLGRDLRDDWPFEDDVVDAEEGEEGTGSQADRVRACGATSELLVAGVGGRVDAVAVRLPLPRRVLGKALEAWAFDHLTPADVEWFDSGVVRSVAIGELSDVREFLEELLAPFEGLELSLALECLGWGLPEPGRCRSPAVPT